MLYQSASTRPASPTGQPAAVGGFLLEAKVLRAYRCVLHQVTQPEMDALVEAVLGPAKPVRASNRRNQQEEREERLEEKVPELVRLLKPQELADAAPLLLDCHDLAAFARQVLALDAGNTLRKREAEPELTEGLDDDALFKVAGLGRLTRQQNASFFAAGRCNSQLQRRDEKGHFVKGPLLLPTGGPPLVLTPWPPVVAKKPSLRTAKRRTKPAPVLRGQLTLFAAAAGEGAGL